MSLTDKDAFILISAHKYHSRQEFLTDVERILQNCVLYNGKDSSYTQKAEALFKAAQETLEEVSEPVVQDYNLTFFNKYISISSTNKCLKLE